MFDKLFKFDSIQFAEGEIGFQVGQLGFLLGFIVVFLVVGFCVVYFITNIYTSDRARAVSLGLRIPALLLLCLPLFEPVLITPDVVPDENFVAVVVDGSASMTIPDGAYGPTRAADARHILFDEDDGILPGIEENFKVRYYTFSDDALRTEALYWKAHCLEQLGRRAPAGDVYRALVDGFPGSEWAEDAQRRLGVLAVPFDRGPYRVELVEGEPFVARVRQVGPDGLHVEGHDVVPWTHLQEAVRTDEAPRRLETVLLGNGDRNDTGDLGIGE